MAGRFSRSFYRFSSVNRPNLAPAANTSGTDSAQYDRRQYPSTARDSSLEPRVRSPPLSPRRESLTASPTYSPKKPTTPPYSPPRAPPARVTTSPPKTVEEYPKYRPTTRPRSPEARQKPAIQKPVEKVAMSDRHLESGKTVSSHKMTQQPNAINIAGENVGAVMEIVESQKREGRHIIKKKETSTGILNNDISSDKKNEASEDLKAKAPNSLPASTFLNSNFQSVNNSLVYNASLAHRDPGLHIAFSRNPTGDLSTVDDKKQQHSKY